MSVFSDRLRLIMSERNITQAELCRMTGIPKSAVNQYLSGRFCPRQSRTEIICRSLNVNPAWLIGLDNARCQFKEEGISALLSADEFRLVTLYRNSPSVRKKLRDAIPELTADTPAFRAAKSAGGRVAPTVEALSDERLRMLEKAPETDEDL